MLPRARARGRPPGLAAPATRPFPHVTGCLRADFQAAVQAFARSAAGRDRGARLIVLHGCGGFSTFDHRPAGASRAALDAVRRLLRAKARPATGASAAEAARGADPFRRGAPRGGRGGVLRPRSRTSVRSLVLGAGVAIASGSSSGRSTRLAAFSSFGVRPCWTACDVFHRRSSSTADGVTSCRRECAALFAREAAHVPAALCLRHGRTLGGRAGRRRHRARGVVLLRYLR